MFRHIDLGETSSKRKRKLSQLVKQGVITFGGNMQLKIFGTLACSSGKRMKTENRVFFSSENEAMQNGFRPCGNCMWHEYQQWRDLRI